MRQRKIFLLISVISLVILSACSQNIAPQARTNDTQPETAQKADQPTGTDGTIQPHTSDQTTQTATATPVRIEWKEAFNFAKCTRVPLDLNIPKDLDAEIKAMEKTLTAKGVMFYPNDPTEYDGQMKNALDYPLYLQEFCVSDDSNKIIFIGNFGKFEPGLYRFDKNLQVMEEANYFHPLSDDSKTFIPYRPDIWGGAHNSGSKLEPFYEKITKDDWMNSGFQKRENDLIPVVFKNLSIDGSNGLGKELLSQEEHKKYCSLGEKLFLGSPICLLDQYFAYDFVQNNLYPKQACTFYIADDGSKKVLEKCRELQTQL